MAAERPVACSFDPILQRHRGRSQIFRDAGQSPDHCVHLHHRRSRRFESFIQRHRHLTQLIRPIGVHPLRQIARRGGFQHAPHLLQRIGHRTRREDRQQNAHHRRDQSEDQHQPLKIQAHATSHCRLLLIQLFFPVDHDVDARQPLQERGPRLIQHLCLRLGGGTSLLLRDHLAHQRHGVAILLLDRCQLAPLGIGYIASRGKDRVHRFRGLAISGFLLIDVRDDARQFRGGNHGYVAHRDRPIVRTPAKVDRIPLFDAVYVVDQSQSAVDLVDLHRADCSHDNHGQQHDRIPA